MRTTLTLDPDVVAALRGAQRRTGASWKEVVNNAIRMGARTDLAPRAPVAAPYQTAPFDPGAPAVTGVHSVHDLLAFAEGEDFR